MHWNQREIWRCYAAHFEDDKVIPDAKDWLIGKDPNAGKDWGQEEKGMTEDEMIGWHYRLNGNEFEQTLGDNEYKEALSAAVHGVTELDKT